MASFICLSHMLSLVLSFSVVLSFALVRSTFPPGWLDLANLLPIQSAKLSPRAAFLHSWRSAGKVWGRDGCVPTVVQARAVAEALSRSAAPAPPGVAAFGGDAALWAWATPAEHAAVSALLEAGLVATPGMAQPGEHNSSSLQDPLASLVAARSCEADMVIGAGLWLTGGGAVWCRPLHWGG
jgi:hypothetical protein